MATPTHDTGDRTVIDLAEEGLSDGDEIDTYLENATGDNTAVLIPAGTYDWAGGGLDLDGYTNCLVAGAFDPDTGDVLTTFTPTDRVTGRFRDCELWNINIDGENQDGTGGFYPHGDGARLVRVFYPDGGEQDSSRFMYTGEYDMGRTTVERSVWGWNVDNGAYTDKNPMTFKRCVALNNNITQIRTGDRSNEEDTSYVEQCVIGCTQAPRTASYNSSNGRGLRLRQPGRTVCRDSWFVYTDSYGTAIAIHNGADGPNSELVLEGHIHFHLEGGATGLNNKSSVPVDASNATVTVSGTSNPDFDGEITDYTVVDPSEAGIPTAAALTGSPQANDIRGVDWTAPYFDGDATVPDSGSDGGGTTEPAGELFTIVCNQDGAEVDYQFTVDGSVTKATVSDTVGAGGNDTITSTADGTVVDGYTGNAGHGDAYYVDGTITGFTEQSVTGPYTLTLAGTEVTPDEFTDAGNGGSSDGGTDGDDSAGDGSSGDDSTDGTTPDDGSTDDGSSDGSGESGDGSGSGDDGSDGGSSDGSGEVPTVEEVRDAVLAELDREALAADVADEVEQRIVDRLAMAFASRGGK